MPRSKTMGLLDGALSSLAGSAFKNGGDAPSVLTEILGKTDLGSIGGLLNQLQKGGLETLVSSWLGSTDNLPVSPNQLRSALDPRQLQQMATAAGIPLEKLLPILAQHLPGTVDNMS